MQKNTSSQKFVVFAFNRTTNAPITGDAANITANLQIDFGTSTATNDVNPTETEDGFYTFDATQAETNGDALVIYPASSTADIQVIGVPAVIYTVSAGSPDEAIQTVDNNILAAGATGFAAIDTVVDTILSRVIGTIESGSHNPASTAQLGALTDWLDGGRLDLLLDAIPTTAMRGTDSAALASVCTETRLQALTDWLNGGRLDLLLDAIPTTAMRGTDSAATSSKQDTMETTLNAIPTTAMRGTDSANTVVPDAAGTAPTAAEILTTQITESYAADGTAPTLAQALMMIMQNLQEVSYAGTVQTVKKLDGSTTAATYTLDDATNPTSKTRAS